MNMLIRDIHENNKGMDVDLRDIRVMGMVEGEMVAGVEGYEVMFAFDKMEEFTFCATFQCEDGKLTQFTMVANGQYDVELEWAEALILVDVLTAMM